MNNRGTLKRILVYIYFFFPYANANTNVIMPILNKLSETHNIDVVTACDERSIPQKEQWGNYRVFRFHNRIDLEQLLHKDPAKIEKPFRVLKWLIVCFLQLRPVLWLFGKLKNKIPVLFLSHSQKRILRLIEKNHYTAIITLTAPMQTQYDVLALAKLNILEKYGIRWFPYFSDPHATYIGVSDQERISLLAEEYEIYQLADAVFTTPEIKKDNENYTLGDFAEKTVSVPLANLKPLACTDPVDWMVPNKINCLYIGSLWDITVRNPVYFYQLAAACNDTYQFHIVCYSADEPNQELRKHYLTGLSNVHWHDRLPLQICLSAMKQADVLINLGNNCTNQTPSKVFDYISAGKPIVNFFNIERDTSMHYLERYPYKCNIRSKDQLDVRDVEKFQNFCLETRYKQLSFEQVEDLYDDCTAMRASKLFSDAFEARMTDRGSDTVSL